MATETAIIAALVLGLGCGALPFMLSHIFIDENRGGSQ